MNFCDFANPRLAKYKWPVAIEIRETLPESNVGKILKKNCELHH
jgi:long-chain acyl-CoA synthetase